MVENLEIQVKITQQQIWGDVDAEAEELDQYESEVSLIEIIDGYITEEYPDAEIDVQTGFTSSTLVNGDDEHAGNENAEIAAHIEQMIDKAWNGNWEVAA